MWLIRRLDKRDSVIAEGVSRDPKVYYLLRQEPRKQTRRSLDGSVKRNQLNADEMVNVAVLVKINYYK
jgi:hypothetical protein